MAETRENLENLIKRDHENEPPIIHSMIKSAGAMMDNVTQVIEDNVKGKELLDEVSDYLDATVSLFDKLHVCLEKVSLSVIVRKEINNEAISMEIIRYIVRLMGRLHTLQDAVDKLSTDLFKNEKSKSNNQ